jgi:pimeloyl-ACP methyl ester carboxylesterase
LTAAALGLALVAFAASGCFIRSLREGLAAGDFTCSITGELRVPDGWGPATVLLLREREDGGLTLESSWFLYRARRFSFPAKAGTYQVAAFQSGDPVALPAPGARWALATGADAVRVGQGDAASDVVLAPHGAKDDPRPARFASVAEGSLLALERNRRRLGDLVPLTDRRFDPKAGSLGWWSPATFSNRYGWGIFFLQKFDPKVTPVLFVHGAGGYPQQWTFLASRLDRSRFQPWVFQYPSGMRLQATADSLCDLIGELKARHGFERLVVVAHSMGGLVVRSALNQGGPERCAQSVAAFVSISTPWQGQEEAQRAVGQTTYVLPAWLDLAPKSEFLEALHEHGLPPRSTYALFFGYRGGLSSIITGSSDRTVTLRSMLDEDAQAEASTIRGFEEDHDSILVSEAVAQALNRTLDSAVPLR